MMGNKCLIELKFVKDVLEAHMRYCKTAGLYPILSECLSKVEKLIEEEQELEGSDG